MPSRSVAVWLRISTTDQRFDAQLDVVERYIEARGWSVVARFLEEGVSGAAQYRKVVGEILQGARRKQFDAVVIFRGDRSFRSAGKGLCWLLTSSGREVVVVESPEHGGGGNLGGRNAVGVAAFRHGHCLSEPVMGAMGVEVGRVLAEDAPEMADAEDEDVIEAVLAT